MLEDEPPQQEVLAVTLAVLGFDVLCAADVEEALRMLDGEIDAAVLDVIVPDPKLLGRDGLSVLPRSAKDTRTFPLRYLRVFRSRMRTRPLCRILEPGCFPNL